MAKPGSQPSHHLSQYYVGYSQFVSPWFSPTVVFLGWSVNYRVYFYPFSIFCSPGQGSIRKQKQLGMLGICRELSQVVQCFFQDRNVIPTPGRPGRSNNINFIPCLPPGCEVPGPSRRPPHRHGASTHNQDKGKNTGQSSVIWLFLKSSFYLSATRVGSCQNINSHEINVQEMGC